MTENIETTQPVVKPMSRDDRRSLERLIKNNNEATKNELTMLREAAVAQAREESIDATRQRRTELRLELQTEFNAYVRSMQDRAEAEGFKIKFDRYTENGTRIAELEDVKGQTIYDARVREIDRHFQAASRVLYRNGLNIERELLLTSLTSEAVRAFLESIPTAQDLFNNALQLETGN